MIKQKFRKKPVVIEAYQTDKELEIETLEGTMHASIGDWIITGVNGEPYPCKPDIFEKTYEPVVEVKDAVVSTGRTMTREQAVRLLEGKAYMFYGEVQLKALAMAIEALQQQRQEILPKHCIVPSGDYVATAGVPKRGKWIEIDEYSECSCCGAESCGETPFCPYCGARMESDEQ